MEWATYIPRPVNEPGVSVEHVMRLRRCASGEGEPPLTLMPVNQLKCPLLCDWSKLPFDDDALMTLWHIFGSPNVGIITGAQCGPGGDVVLEADNVDGESWILKYCPPTAVRTLTRRGTHHHHFAFPLKGDVRGSNDILGSHPRWRDELRRMGYRIDVDPRASDSEEEQDRAHDEVKRAEFEQGPNPFPLVDRKATAGYCVGPGSVHAKGFVYAMSTPWTPESWCARPTYDASWCPPRYRRTTTSTPRAAKPLSLRELMGQQTSGGADHDVSVEGRIRRARRFLAACPGAVSGNGGHARTFSVAVAVIRGFDLVDHFEEAFELLREWSDACCSPPWSADELIHKLDDAAAVGAMDVGEKIQRRVR